MKIGNLEFKDFAAKKPLTMTSAGKFVTASEVLKTPSLSLGSVFTLSFNQQKKLTLDRYEIEPDFKLGIIGVGILTKNEVIDEIHKESDFGRQAIQAEMGYCNSLLSDLATRRRPIPWPDVPVKPVPEYPHWKPIRKCFYFYLRTRVLFCENTTDNVTRPFAEYRMKHVHPIFRKRGFTVIVLKGTDNVRANFVPHARNRLTVYLNGIGHGNYEVYTGHWGDPILQVGHYNAEEVKNKGIHFLSCKTARQLGPDTVKNKAKFYAGYNENFILQWDDGSTANVNEFELFARSDSTFDIMIAIGATAQQAYDATIKAFNAAISQVPNTIAATYLTLDRDRFQLHGAGSETIKRYRKVKVCFPIRHLENENALVEAGELEEE
jgi:hypothetical protein